MTHLNRPCVLLLAVILAACTDTSSDGNQAASETPGEAAVFRRGNTAEPETLDPHRAEGTPEYNVLRDLFEGLTSESVTAKLEPGAAKTWEVSEDGTRYVFHLQPEGRWSNGDRVTAHDFVAGFRRVVDPVTGSPNARLLIAVDNAQEVIKGELSAEHLGVSALSDSELEIVLTAPTPYFLGLLNHAATYPIHHTALAGDGKTSTRSRKLISNGPYRLAEWRPNEYIELKKNRHYWNNAGVAIETVRFYPVEDAGTELRKYRAGELDFTGEIPSGQFDWVKEHLGDELHVAPYLATYYYILNLHNPRLTNNRKLRQALSMAIDRSVIAENVMGRGEIAAYGWVPPGIDNYATEMYEWMDLSREERQTRARQLYREAGYDPGSPFQTEILHDTGSSHQRVAQTVANMWKSVLGIEATLVGLEWKIFLDRRKSPELWQVSRMGWVGDYNDANTFLEILVSDHNQNIGGYVNQKYDELIRAASVEMDPNARRELLQSAERTMLEDYAIIPVYHYVSKHLVKPYVEGFQPNIMNRSYSRHYRLQPSSVQ